MGGFAGAYGEEAQNFRGAGGGKRHGLLRPGRKSRGKTIAEHRGAQLHIGSQCYLPLAVYRPRVRLGFGVLVERLIESEVVRVSQSQSGDGLLDCRIVVIAVRKHEISTVGTALRERTRQTDTRKQVAIGEPAREREDFTVIGIGPVGDACSLELGSGNSYSDGLK
jgi:hypothetical protein